MDDDDDYEHPDPLLAYAPQNVPGRGCDGDLFDEVLGDGCRCSKNCHTTDDCACIRRSLGPTYDEGNGAFTKLGTAKPVMECNSGCGCDAGKCSNRVVQLGPVKGLEIRESAGKGLGLFAPKCGFARGGFVCEYAGEVIGAEDAAARQQKKPEASMNYILHVNENTSTTTITTIVDPTAVGNVGRYINHSCDPNLTMHPVRTETAVPHMALFANRSIPSGEELTFDYGAADAESAQDDSGGLTGCMCGAQSCRKFLPLQKVTI
jgi:histone-lysine N-methyltransferase SETMAR